MGSIVLCSCNSSALDVQLHVPQTTSVLRFSSLLLISQYIHF